jgi:hypothetical protein
MSYRNDQSKKSSTAFDQASTLVAVVELSRKFLACCRGCAGYRPPSFKEVGRRRKRIASAIAPVAATGGQDGS